VGAGVAGLRCADVLLQHGAKVTIMEGRDRVGGRVPSTSRKSVEIG
jgi:phytoene dehydrogenase-like protein